MRNRLFIWIPVVLGTIALAIALVIFFRGNLQTALTATVDDAQQSNASGICKTPDGGDYLSSFDSCLNSSSDARIWCQIGGGQCLTIETPTK